MGQVNESIGRIGVDNVFPVDGIRSMQSTPTTDETSNPPEPTAAGSIQPRSQTVPRSLGAPAAESQAVPPPTFAIEASVGANEQVIGKQANIQGAFPVTPDGHAFTVKLSAGSYRGETTSGSVYGVELGAKIPVYADRSTELTVNPFLRLQSTEAGEGAPGSSLVQAGAGATLQQKLVNDDSSELSFALTVQPSFSSSQIERVSGSTQQFRIVSAAALQAVFKDGDGVKAGVAVKASGEIRFGRDGVEGVIPTIGAEAFYKIDEHVTVFGGIYKVFETGHPVPSNQSWGQNSQPGTTGLVGIRYTL